MTTYGVLGTGTVGQALAMLILWLRGMQTLGGPMFNVKLVR